MTAFIGSPVRMVWGGLSQSKTVSDAVRIATNALRAAQVSEAEASAEWIALSVFHDNAGGRARARFDFSPVNRTRLQRYAGLCQQRAQNRTPVQYLVGNWDFHGVTLKLRPPVLIPRPETEELVELVLGTDHSQGKRIPGGIRVLDVGCGSGAILIALLAARPTWYGVGLDLSEEAVKLTSENSEACGVESRCAVELGAISTWPGMVLESLDRSELGTIARRRSKSDTVDGTSGQRPKPKGNRIATELVSLRPFDVLVSNPPYIPPENMGSLQPEVLRHEDVRALAGGGVDGLDVVWEVLRRSVDLVRPGGTIWLEVDPSQPEKIAAEVAKGSLGPGLCYVRTVQDFAGMNRFCELRMDL